MKPDLTRGDDVLVREPNIRPWSGRVLSVKPGKRIWWVEIKDVDGVAFSVPSRFVEKVA